VAAALTGDRSTWSLPVVAETWDGVLNDVNGFHVRPEHARAALDAAANGPVDEGNVGGGTGMISHGFKGGIGTASRVTDEHTVGVLVQANHGTRSRLVVDGVPAGRLIGPDRVPLPPRPALEGAGSIVVVVATDAPLLPHQCSALALRAMLGVARTGGAGEWSSGDFAIAFSTGPTQRVKPVPQEALNPLFYAAIEATEEAIVNALLAAETTTGRGGATVYALEPSLLQEAMSL
jgi:D-aminopeptidase